MNCFRELCRYLSYPFILSTFQSKFSEKKNIKYLLKMVDEKWFDTNYKQTNNICLNNLPMKNVMVLLPENQHLRFHATFRAVATWTFVPSVIKLSEKTFGITSLGMNSSISFSIDSLHVALSLYHYSDILVINLKIFHVLNFEINVYYSHSENRTQGFRNDMGLKHPHDSPKICDLIHSANKQVPKIQLRHQPWSSSYHQPTVWQYEKEIKMQPRAISCFSRKEIEHLADFFYRCYV